MRVKPSRSLKELTLLYVEDDEGIREVLSTMLRRHVGRLYVASDGVEGLELYKVMSPDIVVSDIRMPRLDGIGMVRKIKAMDPEAHVVFTTAFGDSEYLHEAIELGVDGYLVKPIDRNRLIAKLNAIADAILNARRKETYFKLLNLLFDTQKEVVILVDAQGTVQFANDAYARLCDRCHVLDRERLEAFLELFVEEKGCALPKFGTSAAALRRMDGETVCIRCAEEGIRYYEMHVRGVDDLFLVEMHDITHLKKEALALAKENVIDQLTGLYNRKIEETIREEYESERERALCFMLIDIDHFKQINDNFGHTTGDRVLRAVSALLSRHIRKDDYLIRWGGEEFLLVARGIGGENAVRMAEKLRKTVESFRIEEVGGVSVSVGVCCRPSRGSLPFDALLKAADNALYRAKEKGRNRVERCQESE